MAFDWQTFVGANLGEIFQKVVGTFKADPNKVLEMQELLAQNEGALAQAQLVLQGKLQDAVTSEVEAASENIRAEATNGDRYTSRARPSFIYVMLGVIVANYVVFPVIGRPPINFPEALFWLFGSCMLGYTGARSWEKYADKKFQS